MTKARRFAIVLGLTVLAGCAGSGGGGGGGGVAVEVDGEMRVVRPTDGSRPLTAAELALCIATAFLVCGYWDDEHATSARPTGQVQNNPATSQPSAPAAFTSWSDHAGQPWGPVQVNSLETSVPYEVDNGVIRATAAAALTTDATNIVRVDKAAYLEFFSTHQLPLSGYGKPGLFVFPGHPDIEIMRTFGFESETAFADESHKSIGLVANPYALGWDYQAFGAWSSAQDPAARVMGATSMGAPTPALSVPAEGSAAFTGKLAGLYVSPAGAGSMAAATLAVTADFGARSLSFASSGTTIAREISAATAAPQLDLSGSLSYAPGAGAFAGTLTNAGGSMSGTSSGRFYGPAAQELGGVFALKSATTAESFTGAYGAKR
jgi:hypothetical protein